MSELGAYVIAAGGTGGHVFPGIALADEIRAQKRGRAGRLRRHRAGPRDRIVPAAGYPLELVDASGFVGKTSAKQVAALAGFRRGSSRRGPC